MRIARTLLLFLAALFILARCFTGIVYEYDDPTTYLVLKQAPSLAIEQENSATQSVHDRFVVIDGGENELAYQRGYTMAMQSAFGLAAGCLALAVLAHRGRRVRRSGFS